MSEMSLDEIMSGRGQAVSEPVETAAPEAPAPAAPADGATRDDKGRFAAKTDPAPTQPAAAPVVDPAAPAPEPVEQQPNGFVPIKALDSERGKRKELEDRYEKDMRELRDQIARLSQPATPAEPPAPPPSMFEDPDAYLQHQISPLQQQLQEVREELWESRAAALHSPEAVNAAKEAANALAGTPQGRALHQQIMAGGNPFDNLVKWHKSQSVLTEIGPDPEAYKKRIIEEYLAQQQQQPQEPTPAAPAAAPVLPTAFSSKPTSGPRGGAEYGGPRPLSEIMKR